MGQEEYTFEQSRPEPSGALGFIWNSNTKEFCGRDGASWAKVSLFYAVFYTFLGSFFVGMLAVFVQVMPRDKPMYFGTDSTMNSRGLNPGLGFRPQIDVEDHLIAYNPNIAEGDLGFMKYYTNLDNYLNAKYTPIPSNLRDQVIDCKANNTYIDDLTAGRACAFDPSTTFKNSECTKDNSYGYKTGQPCVLIKVNKIVDWVPESSKGGIEIKCAGETAADVDNLASVTYYSESKLNEQNYTLIDSKFYPYFNQQVYRAPFVWARFTVTPNTLVNVVCKAYADNIDNEDRMNRRGQTKFSLYVDTTE